MPLSAVFHTSSLQQQVAALSDAFAIAGEFLHCDVINSGPINMTFRATYRKPDGTTRRYIDVYKRQTLRIHSMEFLKNAIQQCTSATRHG